MHEPFLQQALQLAKQRQGFCAPNPPVGAVLVKNGEVIAVGNHYESGAPHAEVAAIAAAGASARGATLYVTLEPCCHYGKTPPCSQAIIQSGVTRLIYAMEDPNPQVAGKGVAQCRASGIDCELFSLTQITQFYAPYCHWMHTGFPWVCAKLALSLDGKICLQGGTPISLTGEAFRTFTHQMRLMHDAILTTVTTIIHDDPQLNVRLPAQTVAKPVYVLDSQLRFPIQAKVCESASQVTLFYDEAYQADLAPLLAHGLQCVPVPCVNGKLDLAACLHIIGRAGRHRLWVEAGGNCLQQLLQSALVQEAYFALAPKWLGEQAQSAFTTLTGDLTTKGQISWQVIGDDAVCHCYFTHH